MMAVADAETSLVLTGNGDVLEPEDGLIGIGSGGSFALAAARALVEVDGLDAEAIARKAMKIAGDICIYTNENIRSEEHTSELQSLMRISYAVFCLTKKTTHTHKRTNNHTTEAQ